MEPGASALRRTLATYLSAGDRDGAVATALEAVASERVEVLELYDLLAELLLDIGSRWNAGELEVWQEHLATAAVRTIVEACAPHVAATAEAPTGLRVVLATPPEEHHDVGLRMLADRFRLAGWTTHLLGASVPAKELSAAVTQLAVDAAALSVSTHFHRVALRSYLDALRADHPPLRVWVGGAAFARTGDGWDDATVLDLATIPALTTELRS